MFRRINYSQENDWCEPGLDGGTREGTLRLEGDREAEAVEMEVRLLHDMGL